MLNRGAKGTIVKLNNEAAALPTETFGTDVRAGGLVMLVAKITVNAAQA